MGTREREAGGAGQASWPPGPRAGLTAASHLRPTHTTEGPRPNGHDLSVPATLSRTTAACPPCRLSPCPASPLRCPHLPASNPPSLCCRRAGDETEPHLPVGTGQAQEGTSCAPDGTGSAWREQGGLRVGDSGGVPPASQPQSACLKPKQPLLQQLCIPHHLWDRPSAGPKSSQTTGGHPKAME